MRNRILGGTVHIIPHPDLHFLHPQPRIRSIRQHLALYRQSVRLESEHRQCVGSKCPKSALRICNALSSVHVGDAVKDALTYAAVCRRVLAVAVYVTTAVDHVCLAGKDWGYEMWYFVRIMLSVRIEGDNYVSTIF